MTKNILNQAIQIGAIGLGVLFVLNRFKKKQVQNVDVPVDPTALTTSGITNAEAVRIANRLYNAMYDFGTNENQLFANLQPLSASDLIKVYNAYGQKDYALVGSIPFTGSSLDLFGWFQKELGKNDLNRMRDLWAKTGLIFPM
mgnify:FL=1